MKRRKKLNPDMDACKRLALAVIARASEDYREWWRRGIVRNRVIVQKPHSGEDLADAQSLCRFFGDAIDKWMPFAARGFDGDSARKTIEREPLEHTI